MPDILDDMTIRNMKATGNEYTKRERGGFGVRVHPSGRKVFFYLYRVDGVRRFLNLGDYKDKQHPNGITLEEARRAFNIEKGKVTALKAGRSDGVDPAKVKQEAAAKRVTNEEERCKAFTVENLVIEYIEKHAKKFKRSWAEDERILNKEVIPLWGKRKAIDIVKRDVVLLLEKIIERGSPGMSNNTFQVIRKMLNFAVERDILPYSPATGVKALAPKVARERALSADEIKKLWWTLDNAAISDEIKAALRLMLVTAQRPGEVIGVHTNEIDGDWWTIPSERSKNGKAHRVFLTPSAKGLITRSIDRVKAVREISPKVKYEGHIFPCPHREKIQSIDVHAVAIAVHRNLAWPLLDKKGNPLFGKDGEPATENRLGVDHFTPHDLRRTAATFMAQAGEMDEVIDAVLNHAKQGVIKVYNLYRYDKEKQMALLAWEIKLLSIINSNNYECNPK
ncbi:site-specific integrase [Geobacter sp. AOG2]|uniref:tyrosine-type recombinase/integrase n=1 Tax=Geobacter sp. AOG2 TaxID=1566347 RepID=UPI001CC82F55|nr:site-specific integrase [Geobacter sp. AOG2]GFE60583.1 integrase [Geobacter sp. AOG2]